MSTNAIIAYSAKPNLYVSVYLHWDGYPEEAGKTLKTHYTTSTDVYSLVAGGPMSELGDSLYSCVYYGRDRGEDYAEPVVTRSMAEMVDKYPTAEYLYLWEDGQWYTFEL